MRAHMDQIPVQHASISKRVVSHLEDYPRAESTGVIRNVPRARREAYGVRCRRNHRVRQWRTGERRIQDADNLIEQLPLLRGELKAILAEYPAYVLVCSVAIRQTVSRLGRWC